jgi:hypothetical protein
MKTTFIRTASRCLAMSALVLALGQSAAWAGSYHSSSKRITGVWNARVNITNCLPGNVPGPIVFASFDAMNVYAADGTFLDTNSGNPATQSEHFGYWRHIRGNKYEFAQRFFLFDAAGVATGFRIVRHQVLLDRTGLSFTSGGYAETFDMAGVLQTTGCSTSSAVRFD